MNKIIYILLAISLVSCRTTHGVTVKNKDIKYENADEEKLFTAIHKTNTFSSLKIKATADIEAGSNYPSVALTLYLDQGKQIWANASLLLPLARASIMPSGFKMYEKIGKTYIDSDFDYVNNLLKVDFIDYQSMENLLVGKLFFPVAPQDYTLKIQDNKYVLTSDRTIPIGSGKNTRNFASIIAFDSNFNLLQVVLEDKLNNTYLQVDYDNYVDFENKILPKNIKIFIKEKKEAKISLDYNKFETVKMQTPFDIPKGYTQRKIN
ncbi:DUF4292 domain-containing protein [Apibacter raozihei]|uniref:DUF4292 domain-containing protein n=1 Tax=Apibacter TaxID=1778601 RepID=UPI000FE3E862|nr:MULTISPECIES: DUF4292 domain-containing protein [Apibacter]